MNHTATANRPLGYRQVTYLWLLAVGPKSIQFLRTATGLDKHRVGRGYRPMHSLRSRGYVVPTDQKDDNRGTLWAITDAGREALRAA
jgi:DNA-binding PadR family transcriptional regulator